MYLPQGMACAPPPYVSAPQLLMPPPLVQPPLLTLSLALAVASVPYPSLTRWYLDGRRHDLVSELSCT